MLTIIKNSLASIFLFIIMFNYSLFPHCDSMEGPVVKACINALKTGNINYVLIWVSEKDETVIKDAFQKTLKVRRLNEDARELADMYFFETVVRIHRAGEGESYTGLKPVGYVPPKGISLADRAIEIESIDMILKEQTELSHKKIKELFNEVIAKKTFNVNNVKAGRDYVKAYVHFIHYIEELYGEVDHPVEHKH